MKEVFCFKGKYVIELIDAVTMKKIKTIKFDNMLTSINSTIRQQMLMGTYTGNSNGLQIQYFAFGTGTTPVTINDTKLSNEVYRKQVTQISSPANGTVQSIVSLGAQEANFTITEIGVFCGPNASSSANTGTMISRALTTIEKNSNLIVNVVRLDICTIN